MSSSVAAPEHIDEAAPFNMPDPSGPPVERRSQWAEVVRRLLRNRFATAGLILALALIVIAIFAPWISPHDPITQFDNGLSPVGMPLSPNSHFLLGTDELGRDMESRLIYGARISLLIGTLANGLAVLIGVVLGAIGGYFGRVAETIVMRLTDVMMAFPLILFLIALAVVLQPSVGIIILVIAIGGWPGTARLIYGEVVALKEREFIQAARAIGASDVGILVRHILPHLLPPIIVWTMLGVAPAILTESVLSFLGVGVQPPTPSWGNMIGEGQTNYFTAPWLVLWPGLALMLTVISFNLVGDGLRDALDIGEDLKR
jgi:peptide/nickel transport system permease protein